MTAVLQLSCSMGSVELAETCRRRASLEAVLARRAAKRQKEGADDRHERTKRDLLEPGAVRSIQRARQLHEGEHGESCEQNLDGCRRTAAAEPITSAAPGSAGRKRSREVRHVAKATEPVHSVKAMAIAMTEHLPMRRTRAPGGSLPPVSGGG